MDSVISFTPRLRTVQPDRDAAGTLVSFGGRAVYTVNEVSNLLSLSLGSTYALVRSGEIPGLKLGGRWVIPKKRFHAWLDSCVEPSDPPVGRSGAWGGA